MSKFVSSRAIPDDMVERVAAYSHRRECGSFDGGRNRPVAPMSWARDPAHKSRDLLRARLAISDVVNALGLSLAALAAAVPTEPAGETP